MTPEQIRNAEWWLGNTVDMLLDAENSPSISHRVWSRPDGEGVEFLVDVPEGEQSAILIGKMGSTVEAIRSLLRVMYRGEYIHVQIGRARRQRQEAGENHMEVPA